MIWVRPNTEDGAHEEHRQGDIRFGCLALLYQCAFSTEKRLAIDALTGFALRMVFHGFRVISSIQLKKEDGTTDQGTAKPG